MNRLEQQIDMPQRPLEGDASRSEYLEYLENNLGFGLNIENAKLVSIGTPKNNIPRKTLVHYMLATLEISEGGKDPNGEFATRMYPGSDQESIVNRVNHLINKGRTVWISTALSLPENIEEGNNKYDQYSKLFRSINSPIDFEKHLPEIKKIMEEDPNCWFKIFPQDNNDLQAIGFLLSPYDPHIGTKYLRAELWPGHTPRDFDPEKGHELSWISFDVDRRLIFTNELRKSIPLLSLLANLPKEMLKKIDILLNTIAQPNTSIEGMVSLTPSGEYELQFLNDFDIPHNQKTLPVNIIIQHLIQSKQLKNTDFEGDITKLKLAYLINQNHKANIYFQIGIGDKQLRDYREGSLYSGKPPTQTVTINNPSRFPKLTNAISRENSIQPPIIPGNRPPKIEAITKSTRSAAPLNMGYRLLNNILSEYPISEIKEIIYSSRLKYFTIKFYWRFIKDYQIDPSKLLKDIDRNRTVQIYARQEAQHLLEFLEYKRVNGNKIIEP